MTTKPTIYFDLDGTLYDLYAEPNWLERITTLADASAYANYNATMVDMVELHNVLFDLIAQGYTIGVVTWLAMDSTKEYSKAVRAIKRQWVKDMLPMATEVHVVKYGTPKHSIIKNKLNAIIVDDNDEVRWAWKVGRTINAKEDIIPQLRELVA